jgi:hypothetical protein
MKNIMLICSTLIIICTVAILAQEFGCLWLLFNSCHNQPRTTEFSNIMSASHSYFTESNVSQWLDLEHQPAVCAEDMYLHQCSKVPIEARKSDPRRNTADKKADSLYPAATSASTEYDSPLMRAIQRSKLDAEEVAELEKVLKMSVHDAKKKKLESIATSSKDLYPAAYPPDTNTAQVEEKLFELAMAKSKYTHALAEEDERKAAFNKLWVENEERMLNLHTKSTRDVPKTLKEIEDLKKKCKSVDDGERARRARAKTLINTCAQKVDDAQRRLDTLMSRLASDTKVTQGPSENAHSASARSEQSHPACTRPTQKCVTCAFSKESQSARERSEQLRPVSADASSPLIDSAEQYDLDLACALSLSLQDKPKQSESDSCFHGLWKILFGDAV